MSFWCPQKRCLQPSKLSRSSSRRQGVWEKTHLMTRFRVLLQEEKNPSLDTPPDPPMTSPWTTKGAEVDRQPPCTHPPSASSAPPWGPRWTRLRDTQRPQLLQQEPRRVSDLLPSHAMQHMGQTGQTRYGGDTHVLSRATQVSCTHNARDSATAQQRSKSQV